MNDSKIWVLGASDPEMARIEQMLAESGQTVVYAGVNGRRVHPGNAVQATQLLNAAGEVVSVGPVHGVAPRIMAVECDGYFLRGCVSCGQLPDAENPGLSLDDKGTAGGLGSCSDAHMFPSLTRIDHHAPGDPGYGRPPHEFLEASSIGQVLVALDGPLRIKDGLRAVRRNGALCAIRTDIVLAAAADHCLAAAYRGECPGVVPEQLGIWRAVERAKFQGRSPEDVLADVRDTQKALVGAALIDLGGGVTVRDMRGAAHPELPEAATRLDVGYMAGPLVGPDGRSKVVMSGSYDAVRMWLNDWAPANGLVDLYGDPARGFAGGYQEGAEDNA